ncbi:MAG: GGDEF domain-containing protein [Chloroflexi bacterium]|nr:GGDEF domain-containing protein [Chloroflexota bacterium]MBV9131082.1 GGDEF domain-containing protein [Chloroflexota bacterium]
MTPEDPVDLLRQAQERSAQLETYAADLSRTYGELRRHLHHMTVLHEVSTRIVSALDPEEVLSGVLNSLSELVTYVTAAIYLVDLDVAVPAEGPRTVTPAGGLPRLRASRSAAEGPPERVEGLAAAEDSTVVEAMRDQQTVGRMLPSGVLQLVVPLVAGGRALGAQEVTLRAPLGIDDVKILELLAAAAAVALQNAHLYQETQRLATTDPLTGLSNYRHFHELLSYEVQRARRMEYAVGLLMMDLDHFKQVNDRHGHPAGDQALRQVAELLRKRLRRTDIVGRVGGEEFAAILPGDGPEEVAIVAEKLRKAVEEMPPVTGGMGGESTRITLSVGGASLGADVLEAHVLIGCADRALYEAKRNGRNQVRLGRAPQA